MSKPILKFLPLFYEDLSQTVDYIRDVLQNNQAANDLVDAVGQAIIDRCENPESFEIYISSKQRDYPYYRIYVKNYVIYYVVIPGDPPTMEVRRFLYSRRNAKFII